MIYYVNGDATYPELVTPNIKNIIVHCCNDIGGWGAGFVLAISRRWKEPERQYRAYYRSMRLGDVRIVKVEENIAVCNLIGQHGILSSKPKIIDYSINPQKVYEYTNTKNYIPPIRYDAIECGFKRLYSKIKDRPDIVVHMPRIGCGLAGGDWNVIEQIINKVFINTKVYVYDYN